MSDCHGIYIYIVNCMLRSGKNFIGVMDLSDIMAKLNKIIDNNQKLQIGLDIINICLDL